MRFRLVSILFLTCALSILTSCKEVALNLLPGEEIDMFYTNEGDFYSLHLALPLEVMCNTPSGYEKLAEYFETQVPVFHIPDSENDELIHKWWAECEGRVNWTYVDENGGHTAWHVVDCHYDALKKRAIDNIKSSHMFEMMIEIRGKVPSRGGLLGESGCFSPEVNKDLRKKRARDAEFELIRSLEFTTPDIKHLELDEVREIATELPSLKQVEPTVRERIPRRP